MEPIYSMQGVGELLEVSEDSVSITPKGLMGLLSKGLKGTKTIPISSISAIQFKKAGLMNGYLQFTIPGGNESRAGLFAAASDENTFMFRQGNEQALEIKTYLEGRIKELRSPPATRPVEGVSGELARLGEMLEKGFLTQEEFMTAKKKLLS